MFLRFIQAQQAIHVPEAMLPRHNEANHAAIEAAYLHEFAVGATAALTLFWAYFAYHHTKTHGDIMNTFMTVSHDIYLAVLTVFLKLAGRPQDEIQAKIEAERDIYICGQDDPDESILPYWSSPSSPASDPGAQDISIFILPPQERASDPYSQTQDIV